MRRDPTAKLVFSPAIRGFHWLLVLLVGAQIYTGRFGDGVGSMAWHERFGFLTLVLVVFRVLFGIWGDQVARFSYMLPRWEEAQAYARSFFKRQPVFWPGHSPSAALGAIGLLTSCLVQAVTGLFSKDDIVSKGPLSGEVSEETSSLFTAIHEINSYILFTLIALHLAAITFYAFYKTENLLPAMLSGRRHPPATHPWPPLRFAPWWLTLATFVLAFVMVAFAVYG